MKIAVLLLLSIIGLSIQNPICSAGDPACQECLAVPILFTGSWLYVGCLTCSQYRSVHPITGNCVCSQGYYSTGTKTCAKCPATCSSCESQSKCTSCYSQYNRVISGNSCVCIDGYEQKNGELLCRQKPSILMIVLSTIGSAICMVLGFVVCAYIRTRRGSQQIHAQNKNRRSRQDHAQIEIYNATGIDTNNSNMYWHAKNHVYKQGQICSICLDTSPMFMTQCEHYFHGKCIYGWLKNKKACPNCNSQIDEKQMRRWCQRCKHVVMPVVMNITINRSSKKSKKDQIIKTPLQSQYCDSCQIQISNEHRNESLSYEVSNVIEKQPQSSQSAQIWR